MSDIIDTKKIMRNMMKRRVEQDYNQLQHYIKCGCVLQEPTAETGIWNPKLIHPCNHLTIAEIQELFADRSNYSEKL